MYPKLPEINNDFANRRFIENPCCVVLNSYYLKIYCWFSFYHNIYMILTSTISPALIPVLSSGMQIKPSDFTSEKIRLDLLNIGSAIQFISYSAWLREES